MINIDVPYNSVLSQLAPFLSHFTPHSIYVVYRIIDYVDDLQSLLRLDSGLSAITAIL